MAQPQQSRWRPTRRQLPWAGVAVALMIGAVLVGYRYDITLWDWIKLLIVPAVIAGGGLWYNREQRERELAIANAQRAREVDIADQRSQDEALQAYLDQMAQLLLDKERPLRQSKEGDEVRILARARTLTVLARLDGDRKGSVVQFLYESRLIQRPPGFWVKDEGYVQTPGLSSSITNFIDLEGADLSGANLSGAHMIGVSFIKADLSGANLSGADITSAHLHMADLSGANLSRAALAWADLTKADLSEANLSEAILYDAHLREAVGCTEEQLRKAASLEGSTMPDGRTLGGVKMPNGPTFEDWLKDKKAREEDGKNDGSS